MADDHVKSLAVETVGTDASGRPVQWILDCPNRMTPPTLDECKACPALCALLQQGEGHKVMCQPFLAQVLPAQCRPDAPCLSHPVSHVRSPSLGRVCLIKKTG